MYMGTLLAYLGHWCGCQRDVGLNHGVDLLHNLLPAAMCKTSIKITFRCSRRCRLHQRAADRASCKNQTHGELFTASLKCRRCPDCACRKCSQGSEVNTAGLAAQTKPQAAPCWARSHCHILELQPSPQISSQRAPQLARCASHHLQLPGQPSTSPAGAVGLHTLYDAFSCCHFLMVDIELHGCLAGGLADLLAIVPSVPVGQCKEMVQRMVGVLHSHAAQHGLQGSL